MGLLDWFQGQDSIERSVVNKALDNADRAKAETASKEEEEGTRKIQEQLVLTEEMMRVNKQLMELDSVVRRTLKEVGTRTWGKNGFEENLPPYRFTMEVRDSQALMTSCTMGAGKRLEGPPAEALCYQITIRFNKTGNLSSWNVEGQPIRPAPLTIDVLAPDLAEAYRQGPIKTALLE